MDKREYDQLIKTAADLEREAEVECKRKLKNDRSTRKDT